MFDTSKRRLTVILIFLVKCFSKQLLIRKQSMITYILLSCINLEKQWLKLQKLTPKWITMGNTIVSTGRASTSSQNISSTSETGDSTHTYHTGKIRSWSPTLPICSSSILGYFLLNTRCFKGVTLLSVYLQIEET